MQKKSLLLLSAFTFCTNIFAASLSQEIKNSSLLVYSSNLGLVHEERDLNINKNDSEIVYDGVASSINTDSVNIQLSDAISLYSQKYRYNKLTLHKLLEANIGKKVEVKVDTKDKNFKLIKATLLAYSSNTALVQTKENKIISIKNDTISFTTLPKEFQNNPSLVWNVKSKKNLYTKVTLEYLINKISFHTSYLLSINEGSASITAWASINNRSGKSFQNTKLTLLAGDIHRVKEIFNIRPQRTMLLNSQSHRVVQTDYKGYHLYTIPFKVSLANNEKTEIKFLSQKNINCHTEYEATLSNPFSIKSEIESPVTQFIKLAPLKIPLPKGVVRVYSQLQDHTVLLGESQIAHTPKNKPLTLQIGTHFDLEVKQIPLERDDSSSWFNTTLKYSITNNSDKEKLIQLLVPFNTKKSSKITSDEKYRFTKGNFVTFSIKVKANSAKNFIVNYESKK
jgi:hypothetical protein